MAPRQLVILRHAEKPDDPRDPDLSPEGDARAQMLATLIPRRFPNPDRLFCAARSRHSNHPYDTLAPLAQRSAWRWMSAMPTTATPSSPLIYCKSLSTLTS